MMIISKDRISTTKINKKNQENIKTSSRNHDHQTYYINVCPLMSVY